MPPAERIPGVGGRALSVRSHLDSVQRCPDLSGPVGPDELAGQRQFRLIAPLIVSCVGSRRNSADTSELSRTPLRM